MINTIAIGAYNLLGIQDTIARSESTKIYDDCLGRMMLHRDYTPLLATPKNREF
jgi:hypothetical protein